MATLGITGGIIALSMSGSPKPEKAKGPPVNATSKEEEAFIQYVQAIGRIRVYLRGIIGLLECLQGVHSERQRRGAEGETLRRSVTYWMWTLLSLFRNVKLLQQGAA